MITNPMAKAFRSANLEKPKQHIMTRLMEGKTHSLVDAMLANQDSSEESVRAENKRLQ